MDFVLEWITLRKRFRASNYCALLIVYYPHYVVQAVLFFTILSSHNFSLVSACLLQYSHKTWIWALNEFSRLPLKFQNHFFIWELKGINKLSSMAKLSMLFEEKIWFAVLSLSFSSEGFRLFAAQESNNGWSSTELNLIKHTFFLLWVGSKRREIWIWTQQLNHAPFNCPVDLTEIWYCKMLTSLRGDVLRKLYLILHKTSL